MKFTTSLPNQSPRFSHIMYTGLHAAMLEQFGYKTNNTTRYTHDNPAALHCVLFARCSSAIMRNETIRPPTSMANPRVKAESFYIPLLQLLTMIFGFAAALEPRNASARFCLFVLFVATAIVAISLIVYASTGISQLIPSTVKFTLPYNVICWIFA